MNFAAQGDVAGVLQRLADGVSPNVTNPIGQTALHIAAIWNHVEVATVLLDAGANVNQKNQYGVTPLLFAAQSTERVQQQQPPPPHSFGMGYGRKPQARLLWEVSGSNRGMSMWMAMWVQRCSGWVVGSEAQPAPPPPQQEVAAAVAAATPPCAP